jgi:uncharacterized protein (TIGR02996 family)
MRIEQVFQAICENPEDDELRLEYAKLIEGTDPAHAKLIRVQIKYADDRRGGLRAYGWEGDEEGLIRRHGARWARDIAKFAAYGLPDRVEFDRGFPARLKMHPNVFVEYADLLFRLAPIRHVDFVQPYDEDNQDVRDEDGNLAPYPMDRILACSQLSRLDSVGFVNVMLTLGNPGDPGDVAKIARCPHLTRCVYLNFAFTTISRHDFLELAEGELTSKMLVVAPLRSSIGEQHVNDFDERGDEYTGTVFSEEWRAVERRLGYIPWLHPSHNGVNRFDARWHFAHGKLPKYPPGSPPKEEWYDVPRIYKARRSW